MKCKRCGAEMPDVKKTCSECGSFLEGYTLNNVTGEYGYRGADGNFYKSEEDCLQLDAAINIVSNSGHTCTSDWLKSIKDRVQPKVELTQLDKNILEAAIAFVEQNNHFNCWRGVDKHTVLSALHSLRPQSQWKPSDEQVDALEYYMHTLVCNSYKETLFSLYQDLKKLREE